MLIAWLAAQAPEATAQSSRPGWGATPYADALGTGVTFRTWASNASSVAVAGTFNGWNMSSHPLTLESATSGVWSADIASARTNHNYKYVINGSLWRSDPRSRVLNSADSDNSVILDPNAFSWPGGSFGITNARDIVICEAHAGTFVGPSGTFASFTNRLDYLRDLGISAIELMPVNEFPSATSWGYNPAYPFAVETSYGTPDDLKDLVRQSHERGLAMLLDVVHNHWDGDSSLWQFDGWAPDPAYGGQFFYNTDPYAFTYWGPRPDYNRPEVREFINDSFRMWLGEYRLDGFRWDAPRHIIYTTNEVFMPEGLQMISNALVAMAAEYPGTWNIAEDIKEISGFDSYWDLTFAWEIRSVLTQSEDANRDMPTVARNVAGTFQRILFTDSHDTAGDLNGGVRLPTAIHSVDPAGYYARKRSTLGAALVMTAPGVPMILQGQEMLETNQFSDTRSVDWSRTNSFAGIVRLYHDLIRLRRNLEGVSDGLQGEGCGVYRVDNVDKLIAYSRWDLGATGREVVVVANFANAARGGYALEFPQEGTWYVHFNSDSTDYSADYGDYGSTEVAAGGSPPVGAIDIAPYSVLVLSQTPRTGMLIRETALEDQPSGNGDGILDPGESAREQIVLWNKSQLAASNVSAVLTCDTPGVTILQGASDYPVMAAEDAATNVVLYEYALASDMPCGDVLVFELATTFSGRVVTNVFEHTLGQVISQPPVTNVFESADVPKPIADASTTYSTLTIDEPGSNVVSDVNVQIRINHNYDRDLTLALQHPDGAEVLLVNRRGGSGDNFGTGACGSAAYTILDQGAAVAISNGSPPFAGTYRPEGTLEMFNGKPLNGTWRLRMTDAFNRHVGTNLCWALQVTHEERSYSCNSFSNRPPVATATSLVLVGFAPTNIALEGTDPDGQPLTFQTATLPGHGLLSTVDTSTWQALYTPVHGFIGTDVFDFVAADGLTTGLPATITLAVQAPVDSDEDGMPDAWELEHFTNIVAGVAGEDNDHDGMPNLDEYRANTDPNDSNSVFRLCGTISAAGGFAVQWTSVGGTRYGLQYISGLDDAFSSIPQALSDEMDPSAKGEGSTMTFTDDFTLTPPLDSSKMRWYRARIVNE
ncbi:MAG: alpha amylase C-terminal domain-containing protein [Verrucomicrobia bacterium]|nr:alpha amylase C-terminal domain-containing protein [Verrucomicrobiota bacterium]